MRQSVLVIAFAAFALSANHLLATVIPPIGLAPGSQYQLILVTAAQHDAVSSDISVYNDFVNAQAALNPLLPSTTWHAVLSTDAIDAKVNAPSGGLPVYNAHGIQVASPATGVYTASLLSPIEFDVFGNPNNVSTYVWTGSLSSGDGYRQPLAGYNFTLGNTETIAASFPVATVGEIHSLNWAGGGQYGLDIQAFLYALSDPITVPIPEPGSLTLLGSAFLVIGGLRLLRLRGVRNRFHGIA